MCASMSRRRAISLLRSRIPTPPSCPTTPTNQLPNPLESALSAMLRACSKIWLSMSSLCLCLSTMFPWITSKASLRTKIFLACRRSRAHLGRSTLTLTKLSLPSKPRRAKLSLFRLTDVVVTRPMRLFLIRPIRKSSATRCPMRTTRQMWQPWRRNTLERCRISSVRILTMPPSRSVWPTSVLMGKRQRASPPLKLRVRRLRLQNTWSPFCRSN
mmetsp:Transcript_38874/g.116884  ORF Transcript_38874/g.116884 Transcript_38874/m.116884 type:complete len:214 (-) Transcript_38874:390-1031(-)